LFQSTPLREGRQMAAYLLERARLFQSTPLREGRPGFQLDSTDSTGFNPRPCARGDNGEMHGSPSEESFNPRPCARGDVARWRSYYPAVRFQSTPLREGRQIVAFFPATSKDVSIHAPARGATVSRAKADAIYRVSIHAPARGATMQVIRGGKGGSSFNPRPCARGDPSFETSFRNLYLFQSTPLREGRPSGLASIVRSINVSIHAPARGATDPWTYMAGNQYVSIHAPARGATSKLAKIIPGRQVSIHAPARGATGGVLEGTWTSPVSIHAPARGATGKSKRR